MITYDQKIPLVRTFIYVWPSVLNKYVYTMASVKDYKHPNYIKIFDNLSPVRELQPIDRAVEIPMHSITLRATF